MLIISHVIKSKLIKVSLDNNIILAKIKLLEEEFEDTKEAIRIRISKNRQHNGQKKKYKRTNNDLQNIHIKLKIE
jgi:hypothetical protein